ncbi:MAG: response regulator [Planctomycetaceae bacterium]|nr:response regulator [Planctomycetaceae bacterium]
MERRPRILIIDDDPLFRSLVVSVLRSDFVVAVASDGEEGYYKALEHVPDLAVVDVQMPGWDGLRTLKTFRSQPSLASVPVVMLTGDASKDTVLAAIQAGANDYVIKVSFSKEEFLGKLNRLLHPATAKPPVARTPGAVPAPPAATATTAPAAAAPTATAPVASPAASVAEPPPESMELDDEDKLAEVLDGWE